MVYDESEEIILNDTEYDHIVKYFLHRNGAKIANTGKMAYAAKIVPTAVCGFHEISNRMVKLGCTVKASTIRMVLEEFADAVSDLMADGYEVQLPGFVSFKPAIRGSFESKDETFNPEKHRIVVNATVGRRLLNAAATSHAEQIEELSAKE